MKHIFRYFLLYIGFSLPLSINPMGFPCPQAKPKYAWLYSAVKDTSIITACTAAGCILAPRAWEALAWENVPLPPHDYAQFGKIVLSTAVGAAICYRAYKAQQNYPISYFPEANKEMPSSTAEDSFFTLTKKFIDVTKSFLEPKETEPSSLFPSTKAKHPTFCWGDLKKIANSNFSRCSGKTSSVTMQPPPSQTNLAEIPSTKNFEMPLGFTNPHNNCFMNAVLQVFNNITEITTYLLDPATEQYFKAGSLSLQYKHFLTEMATARAKNSHIFTSNTFCAQARTLANFDQTSQEDAQEFYNFLLDRLSDSDLIKENFPTYGYPYNHLAQSQIGQLFTIFVQSTIVSGAGISRRAAPEKIVSLELPTSATTLKAVLDTYFAAENIDPVTTFNGYRCNRIKQLSLLNTPPIIAFQLKRFGYDSNGTFKIDTPVQIPLELDLSDYYGEQEKPTQALYKLSAIIVHSGSSPNGGHYYAYTCKNSQWYCCNDASVSEFNSMQDFVNKGYYTLSALPYLLFYQRVSEEHKSQHPQIRTLQDLENSLEAHKIKQEQLRSYMAHANINPEALLRGLNQQLFNLTTLVNDIKEYKQPTPQQRPIRQNQKPLSGLSLFSISTKNNS